MPPAAPAFSLIYCLHPPNPLPLRGRGRPKVYFAGGFAPGTPTLNRPRHLQTLPSRYPAGHHQTQVDPVSRPIQPRGCKGRSPLHKKTKSLPLPRRGRGLGGWGQKAKLKAGAAGDKKGKPPPCGFRDGTVSRRGWGNPPRCARNMLPAPAPQNKSCCRSFF